MKQYFENENQAKGTSNPMPNVQHFKVNMAGPSDEETIPSRG